MKVIYGIGKVKGAFKGCVLAIGVFDGLHIGHQKLIKAAVRKAKALGVVPIVMTFFPHPVQVLYPKKYLPFVVSLPHRIKLVERLDVRGCIIVHFTKRFSQLTPRQFILKVQKLTLKKKFLLATISVLEKTVTGRLTFLKQLDAHMGLRLIRFCQLKEEARRLVVRESGILLRRASLN